MNIIGLFSIAVFAAETIISPIPEGFSPPVTQVAKPHIGFAQLTLQPTTPVVLGVTIADPTPTPTGQPRATKKSSMTIAAIGDSMIDTLGPGLPDLANELKNHYPGSTFTILNYGVGGTNIDYGLERLTHDYAYLGQNMRALLSTNPDLVIIESFAFNPYTFDNGALEKHWLQLAAMVDTVRAQLPAAKIMLAATIAPNSHSFGDGAPGIAFAASEKISRTTVIKKYLDSTVKFAASQHIPIADVFHASVDGQGDGRTEYINNGDHIHYSPQGRALFGKMAAAAIINNHLLE